MAASDTPDLGAAGRARLARAVQRSVGNTRMGAMFGPGPATGADPSGGLETPSSGLEKTPPAAGPEAVGAAGPAAMRREDERERPPPPTPMAPRREEKAHLREAGGDGPAAGLSMPALPSGGGSPMPVDQRAGYERALGRPLDHVRVHIGPEADRAARSVDAKAFAVGPDIYFAGGHYAPGTSEGDRTMAHELIHVAQHDAGRVPRPSSPEGAVSRPDDPLEREAYAKQDDVARRASGSRAGPNPAAAPAIKGRATASDGAASRSAAGEGPEPVVLRDEDDGGIVSTALGWLRQGWDGVSRRATEVTTGLKDGGARAVASLRAGLGGVSEAVSSGWDALREGAGGLIDAAESHGAGLIGGIVAQLEAVGTAILSFNADGLRAAWSGLTGVAGRAWAAIRAVAGGAVARLHQQWDGLTSSFGRVVDGLKAQAGGTLDGLSSLARGAQEGLGGLWDSLAGKVGGLLGKLPFWATIQGLWARTWAGVQATAGDVVAGAQSAWGEVTTRAGTIWAGVKDGWASLSAWSADKAGRLVGGFQHVGASLRSVSIDALAQTFTRLGGLFRGVQEAIANPDSVIDPMVAPIAKKLGELPEGARALAREKLSTKAAVSAAPAGGPSAAPGPTTAPAMRLPAPGAPRRTAGFTEALSGVWNALSSKVSKLMPQIGAQVKEMLLSLVWPPATLRGLKQDWAQMTAELSTRWHRFQSIRTDSIADFAEDLGRFISNLLDFPLILWRSANAMVGRFSVYITLLLVLVGGIAGAVGGTVGGAILGALGGGAPAVPGAALGGGAGFLAGAGVGFGAAMAVGQVLLISFLAAETNTILKAIFDLFVIPQTPAEREEDYDQVADSTVALVSAGILFALSWIAVQIARGFLALVKAIRVRFAPPPEEIPGRPRSTVGAQEYEPPTPELEAVQARFDPILRDLVDRITRLRQLAESLPEDSPKRAGLLDEIQKLDDDLFKVEGDLTYPEARTTLDASQAEKLGRDIDGRAADVDRRLGDLEREVREQPSSPGSRRAAPAPENYRGRYQADRAAKGLSRLPDDWDVHHRIPQEYRGHPEYRSFDFDDPSNLEGVKGSRADVNVHQQITNEWAAFKDQYPAATRAQIEAFAQHIDQAYGASWWK